MVFSHAAVHKMSMEQREEKERLAATPAPVTIFTSPFPFPETSLSRYLFRWNIIFTVAFPCKATHFRRKGMKNLLTCTSGQGLSGRISPPPPGEATVSVRRKILVPASPFPSAESGFRGTFRELPPPVPCLQTPVRNGCRPALAGKCVPLHRLRAPEAARKPEKGFSRRPRSAAVIV